MKTLEAFWNGDIAPGQSNGVHVPEMERLSVLLERNRESLEQALSEEQKQMFQRYADCADEFANIGAVQAFCDGFRLASRLMVEA